jgi:hypothetical protein
MPESCEAESESEYFLLAYFIKKLIYCKNNNAMKFVLIFKLINTSSLNCVSSSEKSFLSKSKTASSVYCSLNARGTLIYKN